MGLIRRQEKVCRFLRDCLRRLWLALVLQQTCLDAIEKGAAGQALTRVSLTAWKACVRGARHERVGDGALPTERADSRVAATDALGICEAEVAERRRGRPAAKGRRSRRKRDSF